MGKDPFSYQIFFEKVFNPIALYRVEGDVRSVPSADRIFYVDVNPAYERVMRVRKQDIVRRQTIAFAQVTSRDSHHFPSSRPTCAHRGTKRSPSKRNSALNSSDFTNKNQPTSPIETSQLTQ